MSSVQQCRKCGALTMHTRCPKCGIDTAPALPTSPALDDDRRSTPPQRPGEGGTARGGADADAPPRATPADRRGAVDRALAEVSLTDAALRALQNSADRGHRDATDLTLEQTPLQRAYDALRSERDATVDSLTTKLEKANATNRTLSRDLDAYRAEGERAQREREDLVATAAALRRSLGEYQGMLERQQGLLKSTAEELRQTKLEAQREATDATKALMALQKQRDEAEAARSDAEKRAREIDENCRNLKEEAMRWKTDVNSCDIALQQAEASVESLQRDIQVSDKEKDALVNLVKERDGQIARVSGALADTEERLKTALRQVAEAERYAAQESDRAARELRLSHRCEAQELELEKLRRERSELLDETQHQRLTMEELIVEVRALSAANAELTQEERHNAAVARVQESDVTRVRAECQARLQDEAMRWQGEMDKMAQHLRRMEADIATSDKTILALTSERDELRRQLEKSERQRNSEQQRMVCDMESASAAADGLRRELDEAHAALQTSQAELAELRPRVERTAKDYAEAQASLKAMRSVAATLEDVKSALSMSPRSAEQGSTGNSGESEVVQKLRDTLKKAREDADACRRELREMREAVELLTEQNTSLISEIHDARTEAEDLRRKIVDERAEVTAKFAKAVEDRAVLSAALEDAREHLNSRVGAHRVEIDTYLRREEQRVRAMHSMQRENAVLGEREARAILMATEAIDRADLGAFWMSTAQVLDDRRQALAEMVDNLSTRSAHHERLQKESVAEAATLHDVKRELQRTADLLKEEQRRVRELKQREVAVERLQQELRANYVRHQALLEEHQALEGRHFAEVERARGIAADRSRIVDSTRELELKYTAQQRELVATREELKRTSDAVEESQRLYSDSEERCHGLLQEREALIREVSALRSSSEDSAVRQSRNTKEIEVLTAALRQAEDAAHQRFKEWQSLSEELRKAVISHDERVRHLESVIEKSKEDAAQWHREADRLNEQLQVAVGRCSELLEASKKLESERDAIQREYGLCRNQRDSFDSDLRDAREASRVAHERHRAESKAYEATIMQLKNDVERRAAAERRAALEAEDTKTFAAKNAEMDRASVEKLRHELREAQERAELLAEDLYSARSLQRSTQLEHAATAMQLVNLSESRDRYSLLSSFLEQREEIEEKYVRELRQLYRDAIDTARIAKIDLQAARQAAALAQAQLRHRSGSPSPMQDTPNFRSWRPTEARSSTMGIPRAKVSPSEPPAASPPPRSIPSGGVPLGFYRR